MSSEVQLVALIFFFKPNTLTSRLGPKLTAHTHLLPLRQHARRDEMIFASKGAPKLGSHSFRTSIATERRQSAAIHLE